MIQKTNFLEQIIGRFRYKYEYHSPFGESWSVYRLWFGFIPIKYCDKVYDDMYDTKLIEEYIDELNGVSLSATRERKLKRILDNNKKK
jgi:hypothetical protein